MTMSGTRNDYKWCKDGQRVILFELSPEVFKILKIYEKFGDKGCIQNSDLP